MIRGACLDDVEEMVQYCKDTIGGLPNYVNIPVDADVLRKNLCTMILAETFLVLVLATSQGIRGVFIGCAVQHWFSSEKLACDLVLHISENTRTATRLMLTMFDSWAIKAGCSRSRLGVTTGYCTEGITRLYSRFGYEQAGAVMEKQLCAQE